MFKINETPEIDYYKASLIIRNMIQELFSSSISVQKVELTNNKNHEYENYEDEYDIHTVKMKDVNYFYLLFSFMLISTMTSITYWTK